METTISSKGQVVLPSEIRKRDKLQAGQRFDVERVEEGEYLLKRKAAPVNDGLVDWLLACPEKDWFEPLPSESTDTL
ncbi:MAG: AbrB/MazE/SpoVT family DNA-binding domain-containing protein [Verrucomicrobia subdivision 3 bacterium]|nr:AbrB/MazE/SpoVT family DNA-binding domain-containing protein [Limisphaerales bacterium]